MSSSRQKSHSTNIDGTVNNKERLPCPECGNITMQLVRADCILQDSTLIPNLEYYFCSSCQSKFYDDDAMKKIEEIRNKSDQDSNSSTFHPKSNHREVVSN